MRPLLRRVAVWAGAWCVVAAAVVVPAATGANTACAGEGARAALVVDTGEGVHTFCVALPDDQVDGMELIVLANEQHGLSYRLGFGGEAVCMLAGVGTSGDDCWERYPDFWGYWRGDGSGGWIWSGSGAGSTEVTDGDVEGWSWGSGSNGDTHPPPPRTEFSSVCEVAAARPPRSKPGKQPEAEGGSEVKGSNGGPRPHADLADPADVPKGVATGRPARQPRPRPQGDRSRTKPADIRSTPMIRRSPDGASSLPPDEAASALDQDPSSGPPPAGLAAVGVATALGGAAFFFSRRVRGPRR